MKLYLARHGHTEWNESKKIQGSKDIELSKTGISQAIDLADELQKNNLGISKIYTSQQKRAVKTAEIVSLKMSVPFMPLEGLEEINLGKWEGLTWKDVQKQYPNEFRIWFHNRRNQTAPGGESYQQLLERVIVALNGIIDNNTRDILIITHSAIIMCLKCLIYNTPFEAMGKYKVANTEVIEFEDTQIELAQSLL